MASIAGTYELATNENVVEYFVALGVTEDKAKLAASPHKLEISVDGNKVSLNISHGLNSTFTLNQEVDEVLSQALSLKSTATLNGDTLTISSKHADGKSGTRIYKLSGSELVNTIQSEGVGVVAKRTYKRV